MLFSLICCSLIWLIVVQALLYRPPLTYLRGFFRVSLLVIKVQILVEDR